jgi:hypothetical protein
MHFSHTQLFWECHESTASENYPDGLPKWAKPSWFTNPSVLRQDLYRRRIKTKMSLEEPEVCKNTPTSGTGLLSDLKLYFSWTAFRIHYSQCALTKGEDKLVAIQGIAQQFGQALGDQLVAGLWCNRLLEELCWFKKPPTSAPPYDEVTEWRAPAWSWASSKARIWVSNTTKFHMECQDRQIWSELEDVDVKAKPSDELERASLRIRCKPIRATFELDVNCKETHDYSVYGVLTFQDSMVI